MQQNATDTTAAGAGEEATPADGTTEEAAPEAATAAGDGEQAAPADGTTEEAAPAADAAGAGEGEAAPAEESDEDELSAEEQAAQDADDAAEAQEAAEEQAAQDADDAAEAAAEQAAQDADDAADAQEAAAEQAAQDADDAADAQEAAAEQAAQDADDVADAQEAAAEQAAEDADDAAEAEEEAPEAEGEAVEEAPEAEEEAVEEALADAEEANEALVDAAEEAAPQDPAELFDPLYLEEDDFDEYLEDLADYNEDMDEWNSDKPLNDWYEDYVVEYNEWLEEEPDTWHWEEDYLEDVDDWNQDKPDDLDWDIADYADQSAADREENYARNSAELEEELAEGDLGTAVITSGNPIDSEFEAVYREYDNPVNYQVNFDEDKDGNSMMQEDLAEPTGFEVYDGDTDDSDNPVASYVVGSFLQVNRELTQDAGAGEAATEEAAPAATEEEAAPAAAGEGEGEEAAAEEEAAPAAAGEGEGEQAAAGEGEGEQAAAGEGEGEQAAGAEEDIEEEAVDADDEAAEELAEDQDDAAEEAADNQEEIQDAVEDAEDSDDAGEVADAVEEAQEDAEEAQLDAAQDQIELVADNAVDQDDAPDIDESGDDHSDGATEWILVSSYDETKENSGKIWVIPEDDEDEGYVLISGLDIPVGICFDVNNEFLYVVDWTYGATGVIYQYEVDWDDDDDFEISRDVYTVIYDGAKANDCSVDEYGNLYFTTENHQINIVSYLDLWSGFTNQHVSIYNDLAGKVQYPQGIDVIGSDDIWFVNAGDTNSVHGVLNEADAKTKFLNSEEIYTRVSGDFKSWGVAASDDYVFFTAEDKVYVWDIDDEELHIKNKEIDNPRGIAYGDNEIYVVDALDGAIYKIDADDEDEELTDSWVKVEGAYAIFCVNSAAWLALSLLLLH